MKLFYFVGGPREGCAPEFFRRLEQLGGPPAGWTIHRHAAGGRALHIVEASSVREVLDHLEHFRDIYEHGAIVEILRAG